MSDVQSLKSKVQCPFAVTGMPRSRTAWLAAWLTTDKTICYHDPMPGVTIEELQARNPGKRIGFSGPEVCWWAQKHPEIPCVIIHRPKAEAFESFWKIVQQHPEVTLTRAALSDWWDEREKFLGGLAGKHVSFSLLSNPDTMRNLWEYLLPGIPFDLERYRMLNDLNITQDIWGRKEREWPGLTL